VSDPREARVRGEEGGEDGAKLGALVRRAEERSAA